MLGGWLRRWWWSGRWVCVGGVSDVQQAGWLVQRGPPLAGREGRHGSEAGPAGSSPRPTRQTASSSHPCSRCRRRWATATPAGCPSDLQTPAASPTAPAGRRAGGKGAQRGGASARARAKRGARAVQSQPPAPAARLALQTLPLTLPLQRNHKRRAGGWPGRGQAGLTAASAGVRLAWSHRLGSLNPRSVAASGKTRASRWSRPYLPNCIGTNSMPSAAL